jgi:phospholipase C
MSERLTRGQFLAAGAGAAATFGAGAGISLAAGTKKPKRKKHHKRPIDQIEHVVILMQENRSFDSYYGTLAGVRGFGDTASNHFLQSDVLSLTQKIVPWHLDSHTSSPCTILVDNGWQPMHDAWNAGRMDGWVKATGPYAMSYYNRSDLPWHMGVADEYMVCDRYHCSVLGPTNPNRYMLWTGTIDPSGAGGGPALDNDGTGYRWTTYPERLTKAGVTWRVYHETDDFNDNILKYFAQYQRAKPGSPLYERAMKNLPRDQFAQDVADDKLPQVSWLVAPTADSEHPGNSAGRGADYCAQMLQALLDHPKVYKKTAFILNYDENGGFFDHVAPPTPPAGTPGEFVGGKPIGLGFRVPTVVASPWTRGKLVSSRVFDHTSTLRLLEARFGVREPQISDWRRKTVGNMVSLFDFKHPDYSIPTLPKTAAAVAAADRQCSRALPAVPPVITGTMPKQESGTRIRRD